MENKLLKGMSEFKRSNCGRNGSHGVILNKSGWVTISSSVVREFELNNYKSVEFYSSKPEKLIGLVLHKKRDVNLFQLRHLNKNQSCGFYIKRFLCENESFLGKYNLKNTDVEDDKITMIFVPELY